MGLPKSSKTTPNLNQDLIQLYDDLCEFNDYCSFLCDAVPGLFGDDCDVEAHTIFGARRHFSALKLKAEALKLDAGEIQRRVCGDK